MPFLTWKTGSSGRLTRLAVSPLGSSFDDLRTHARVVTASLEVLARPQTHRRRPQPGLAPRVRATLGAKKTVLRTRPSIRLPSLSCSGAPHDVFVLSSRQLEETQRAMEVLQQERALWQATQQEVASLQAEKAAWACEMAALQQDKALWQGQECALRDEITVRISCLLC
jgi:hypothetical protein